MFIVCFNCISSILFLFSYFLYICLSYATNVCSRFYVYFSYFDRYVYCMCQLYVIYSIFYFSDFYLYVYCMFQLYFLYSIFIFRFLSICLLYVSNVFLDSIFIFRFLSICLLYVSNVFSFFHISIYMFTVCFNCLLFVLSLFPNFYIYVYCMFQKYFLHSILIVMFLSICFL
jgi:hypothetical protein